MPRKNLVNKALPQQEDNAGLAKLLAEENSEIDQPIMAGEPEPFPEASDAEQADASPEYVSPYESLLSDSGAELQDTAEMEQPEGTVPDSDAALEGAWPRPLDVEQRLEEELAEMESDLDAEQPEPDSAGEVPVENPRKKPSSRRKKEIVEDAVADTGDVPENAVIVDVDDEPAVSDAQTAKRRERTEKQEKAERPTSARSHTQASFYQTDFRRLDRDLTEEEQQEWNDIYASFRSKSILTGTVAGVDENKLPVRDETGKVETRVIRSLVVIPYRVKVLIPENAVWMRGEERDPYLLRGMIDAMVDYVITNVDREGEVALASRSLALVKRRRAFITGRGAKPGDIVPCSVLIVGARRCLLQCGGYDVPMRQADMSYSSILDMRELYRPGQAMKARVLEHMPAENKLKLSVREATSNPFDGAERRHPVGSRRQAVITGKYGGGVFCTLQDGTLCMCLYPNSHYDSDFMLGDHVIVHIAQYDYRQKHIYGRIVSKW